MNFPDPNIGYVFGYNSYIEKEAIIVSFLGGLVKIPFKFKNIETIKKEKYQGGKFSWDIIRWGKCPTGTDALKIITKKGLFKNHLIVFSDLNKIGNDLKAEGIKLI